MQNAKFLLRQIGAKINFDIRDALLMNKLWWTEVVKINFDIQDALFMNKTPMIGSAKLNFDIRDALLMSKLRWTEVSKINFDQEIIIGKEFQWTDALGIRFRHLKCKIMSKEFRWMEFAELNFDILDAI